MSREHHELGQFDWIGAIAMLRESVRLSCRCETVAITDVDTTLPGPTLQYQTTSRQLMLWILDVSLAYLRGPDFTVDTVMVSPDCLVFCDLRDWFGGDVGIVVRPTHAERPILNSVQWWPVAQRERLIWLYERALSVASKLSEELQVWGADSEPFRRLLKPLYPGCGPRKCGIVANLIDSRHVLLALTSDVIARLEQGEPVTPPEAVVDFRYLRKRHMRAYFDATIGREVTA